MRQVLPSRISAAVTLLGLTLGSAALPARADVVTFTTPVGASTSGPVDASVTFTTSAGQLSITLKDLQANPTDVAQLISGLSFSLVGGTNAGASLSSSSAQEVTVDKGGTFTPGSTVSTGWALSTSGTTGESLSALGTATSPSELIIGPPGAGGYTNANGSIAGNGPHNPFLNQTATFVISDASITANTTVTNVVFGFGTTAGSNLVPSAAVPEPGPLALAGVGLGVLAAVGSYRRRRRAQAAQA
jgi:hypothetical protein